MMRVERLIGRMSYTVARLGMRSTLEQGSIDLKSGSREPLWQPKRVFGLGSGRWCPCDRVSDPDRMVGDHGWMDREDGEVVKPSHEDRIQGSIRA